MNLVIENEEVSLKEPKKFPNLQYLDTFFIMHFIGKLPSVGISINHLPQAHVTFLGQAHSDSSFKSTNFLNEVKELSVSMKPFSLEAGELKLFGKNQDIPVLELVHTVEAQSLHDSLFAAQLKHNLFLSQPYFAGEFFKPHSSLIEGHSSLKDIIDVDSITISRHIDGYGSGVVEVVEHFFLQL